MEAKEEAEGIKAKFKELGEYLLDPANVPRHPRGYQGPLEYVETKFVVLARDPRTGRVYAIDPTELEPGQGETPQSDVFARDYATVGTRRGTSLVDILLKLAPVVGGPAAGPGGLVDLLGGLFGKKRS